MHLLEKGKSMPGIYNAGFENISILDIARRITSKVPAEIIVSESNDPRSYRLSSTKLLQSGFAPHFCIDDAIDDLIAAHKTGGLRMEDRWFNIKTMKTLPNLA